MLRLDPKLLIRCVDGALTTDRSLLWLAYVEGAEHPEIAEVLNLKEKSVKVLLLRARQRMESVLRKQGFEGSHG